MYKYNRENSTSLLSLTAWACDSFQNLTGDFLLHCHLRPLPTLCQPLFPPLNVFFFFKRTRRNCVCPRCSELVCCWFLYSFLSTSGNGGRHTDQNTAAENTWGAWKELLGALQHCIRHHERHNHVDVKCHYTSTIANLCNTNTMSWLVVPYKT